MVCNFQEREKPEENKEEDQPEAPGLPPEPTPSRPHSGLLTPTTTIESLTKELEHTLDLASATCGDSHVLHRVGSKQKYFGKECIM